MRMLQDVGGFETSWGKVFLRLPRIREQMSILRPLPFALLPAQFPQSEIIGFGPRLRSMTGESLEAKTDNIPHDPSHRASLSYRLQIGSCSASDFGFHGEDRRYRKTLDGSLE